MELKRTFRSGVVLLELMAAILIFALAGAVCVRVLIKADEISARSRHMNEGVNYASSAAEILRSADSPEDALGRLTQAWPQTQVGEELLTDLGDGQLRIRGEEKEDIYIYNIVWYAAQEELYRLELHCFYPEVAP